jgi:hypothetical protein
MDNNGGAIIQNNLSKQGLRTLHILQNGEAPNYEDYLGKVPEAAWPSLSVLKVKDRELSNLWHLWIWWHVREAVQMEMPDGKTYTGVLWTISKGQRASDAIKEAALDHLILLDEWPSQAGLQKLGAEDPRTLEWESDLEMEPVKVELVEMPGLPKRCLFVCKSFEGATSAPHLAPLPDGERKNKAGEGETPCRISCDRGVAPKSGAQEAKCQKK